MKYMMKRKISKRNVFLILEKICVGEVNDDKKMFVIYSIGMNVFIFIFMFEIRIDLFLFKFGS